MKRRSFIAQVSAFGALLVSRLSFASNAVRCPLIDLPIDIRPLYSEVLDAALRGDSDEVKYAMSVATRWCPEPGKYRARLNISFPSGRSLTREESIEVKRPSELVDGCTSYVALRLPDGCDCVVIKELERVA